MLVSGLDMINNTDELSLNLLSEWITGMAGCDSAQEEQAVIAKVIIAGENHLFRYLSRTATDFANKIRIDRSGNSVRSSAKILSHKGYQEMKSYDELRIKEDLIAMNKLDSLLSDVLHSCCVMLMPGEFDPTCHNSLPQQPFHPCTLQKSAR